MGARGGFAGPVGVVVLEDGEEGGLVADVGYALVVEVVEAAGELGWAAEEGDEGGHVVGDEAEGVGGG